MDVLPTSTTADSVLEHAPAGIQSLTEALSGALTISEIADVVYRHVPGLTGAAAGAIVLRAGADDVLEPIGGGPDHAAHLTAYEHLQLDASTPAASVVRSGQPAWINALARAQTERTYQHLPECAMGYQALAALPLVLDNEVSGVLLLLFGTEQAFHLDERMLLVAVAGQCAVALQRAAAFASERASRERLEVALNAASMGTWDWDLRVNRVAWSPELERIHGFDEGGLGAGLDRYFEHLHPDDRERIRDEIVESLESGELHINYRGV
ncbi:MAG TPA: GAF domain-containing protein, partial [Chloroflexota bacterium]